jgi:hypothetical protein
VGEAFDGFDFEGVEGEGDLEFVVFLDEVDDAVSDDSLGVDALLGGRQGETEDCWVYPEVPAGCEVPCLDEAGHGDAPDSSDSVPPGAGDFLGVCDLGGVVGGVNDEVVVCEEELAVAGLPMFGH